uniref:Uncharacterized protein n=1 Tax=Globodera rostochiensis TaxID=31243 RepID=A0A914GUK1_GLORO
MESIRRHRHTLKKGIFLYNGPQRQCKRSLSITANAHTNCALFLTNHKAKASILLMLLSPIGKGRSSAPFALSSPCPRRTLFAMFILLLPLLLLVQLLQASPNPSSVDGDLFMRNWLFRPYLEVPASQPQQLRESFSLVAADSPPTSAAEADAELWRNRRAPLLRPSTPRLADQYTPTPCRWKLCASIFGRGNAFR